LGQVDFFEELSFELVDPFKLPLVGLLSLQDLVFQLFQFFEVRVEVLGLGTSGLLPDFLGDLLLDGLVRVVVGKQVSQDYLVLVRGAPHGFLECLHKDVFL